MTLNISVSDVFQILILYLTFYAILKAARGSRFGQALMGVGILFAVLIAFTYLFKFDVLAQIVRALLAYLAISTVVIFQPEIRRFLATLGAMLFQNRSRYESNSEASPERLTDTVFMLSEKRMGALFAFERSISLRGIGESGVALDAIPSPELLRSIFTEPLPLHDGGVIVRRGRLAAAHCVFPVSNRADLSESGMRHRAGVGITEETDALSVIVSEETGAVSVAHNGRLTRYGKDEEARAAVLRWIRKATPQNESGVETAMRWLRARAQAANRIFRRTSRKEEPK